MGLGFLYDVENPLDRVGPMMEQASNSYAAMGQNRKTVVTPPGKGFGGGIMSGVGGAAAFTAAGWDPVLGGGLAALSYFFS